MRIAQLASSTWFQQLLHFYQSIAVLLAAHPQPQAGLAAWPGPPAVVGQLQCPVWELLRASPEPSHTCTYLCKLRKVKTSVRGDNYADFFCRSSWHAWTLNAVFSGLLRSNVSAAPQELFFASIPTSPSICGAFTIFQFPCFRHLWDDANCWCLPKFSALLFL